MSNASPEETSPFQTQASYEPNTNTEALGSDQQKHW